MQKSWWILCYGAVREGVGGKPAKTGGDVDAAAKERPEEAPFAALRPHSFRLRTCSRRSSAKPSRPIERETDYNPVSLSMKHELIPISGKLIISFFLD